MWIKFDVIKYKSVINMLITMIFLNYIGMTSKSINNIQITKYRKQFRSSLFGVNEVEALDVYVGYLQRPLIRKGQDA